MKVINKTREDYIELCRRRLLSISPKYKPKKDNSPVYDLERYFFRRIKSQKRELHASKCLTKISAVHKPALREISDAIQNGHELLRFQSRFLKKIDYDDMMLGDWGIHHFHLNTTIEADGYVKRTDELLFARFTEKDAYLVGIYNHGDWTDRNIIETIHSEWPESIECFRMNVVSLEHDISESNRKKLRNSGVNTPIQVADSTVYMGPGMGISTAKSPILTTMNGDRQLRYLDDGSKYIEENISDFIPAEYSKDFITIRTIIDNQTGLLLFKLEETGMVIRIQE